MARWQHDNLLMFAAEFTAKTGSSGSSGSPIWCLNISSRWNHNSFHILEMYKFWCFKWHLIYSHGLVSKGWQHPAAKPKVSVCVLAISTPTHPHNTSYASASTSCYKSFIIGLCAEPAVNICLFLVRWFREAAQRRFWLRTAKLFLPALLEPKHWWMSRPFLMRPSFHCQTCTPSEWTLTRHFCTASFIGLWNQITLMAMSMTAVCPSWSNQRQASDFADWDPASSQPGLTGNTGMDHAMETWVLQSSLGAGTSVLSYF